MIGLAGTRVWLMALVEFDAQGRAKIVKSFAKPAKESSVQQSQKEKVVKSQSKQVDDTELF